MQKKKLFSLLALTLVGCFLLTGCGQKAELENNSTIVSFDEKEIKADQLYEKLRDKYGISVLVDMIDQSILEEKYETDEEENTYVDNQVSNMKSQYNGDEASFTAAIQQYLGVENEDELRDMLSLEYKRNLAIEDHVKSQIKNDEVEDYYNEEIIGDMEVRHILIKPDVNDDMSTEE